MLPAAFLPGSVGSKLQLGSVFWDVTEIQDWDKSLAPENLDVFNPNLQVIKSILCPALSKASCLHASEGLCGRRCRLAHGISCPLTSWA